MKAQLDNWKTCHDALADIYIYEEADACEGSDDEVIALGDCDEQEEIGGED